MKTEIAIREDKLEVWIQGEYLKRDQKAIAIVGARKASSKGKALAYHFASTLAKEGITIVSGLALGIDTVAHEAALETGGRTIAVLAHGTDRIYPTENSDLANKIIKSGALITQFPPGTIPVAKNFLGRNQLIAALSKGVLIVEGEQRSGSISTANHAANLNIEVFVIPGSPATDALAADGATVVTSPEEIVEYLQDNELDKHL